MINYLLMTEGEQTFRFLLVSAYLKQVKIVSKTAILIEKQLNYLAENWCIFSAI